MSATTQKSFRLPADVVSVLELQPNATDYLIEAIREKQRREEELRFRESARRIASLSHIDGDIEFAIAAQAEVVLEK